MKNKIIGIFICLMLILTIMPISLSNNVSPIITINDNGWMKTYGRLFNDEMGVSVEQTDDGGFIVVGSKSTSLFGIRSNQDVWLIKLDESGTLMWERSFGGLGDDMGSSVQQTSDGGYIITGETESYSQGKNDVWLIRTDEQGNTLWDKTFGHEDFDSGATVRQTSDDGFILVGWGDQSGGAKGKVLVIKLNHDGNLDWESLFGEIGHNYADDILETSDNSYIVLGSSFIPKEGTGYDVWLIKIDTKGDMIWEKKYDRSKSDHGWSLASTKDGGFIIVGETDHGNDEDKVWVIKTDYNGTLLWDKTFEGRGFSVQQTSDGGFIIAGSTMNPSRFDFSNALLMKIDGNGDLEWRRTFGGVKPDFFFDVQQTLDDGYIATGYSIQLFYWLGSDLIILKTDSEGNAPKQFIRNFISESGKQNTINNNEGKALFASIYLELDPESQQVQDILENYHAIPLGFLTNITITIPDPNDEDGEWFMIAPFFRTLIGQWIGIGPFFDIISPTETTTVNIKILWGDVHYWPPDEEKHEEFIIDGWAPLISWEY